MLHLLGRSAKALNDAVLPLAMLYLVANQCLQQQQGTALQLKHSSSEDTF